jgi:hypothetical protein
VQIDVNAGGFGWFVDPTPGDNSEFAQAVTPADLRASASSPAFGRMDLLTVVLHELGHVLGLGDTSGPGDASGLMAERLSPGERRLLVPAGLPLDPAVTNEADPLGFTGQIEVTASAGYPTNGGASATLPQYRADYNAAALRDLTRFAGLDSDPNGAANAGLVAGQSQGQSTSDGNGRLRPFSVIAPSISTGQPVPDGPQSAAIMTPSRFLVASADTTAGKTLASGASARDAQRATIVSVDAGHDSRDRTLVNQEILAPSRLDEVLLGLDPEGTKPSDARAARTQIRPTSFVDMLLGSRRGKHA